MGERKRMGIKSFDRMTSIVASSSSLSEGAKSLAILKLASGLLTDPHFMEEYRRGGYRLFVDMDGVLTDWEGQYQKFSGKPFVSNETAEWRVVNKLEFWSTMSWLKGGKELWGTLKPLNPILLTSPSHFKGAREGKQIWVEDNIPGTKIIMDSNKGKYATSKSILVDDMEKNIEAWKLEGGIAIRYEGNPGKAAREIYKEVVKK